MPTLNNETVARLPLAASGQYIERDDRLPGFFVVVGKTRKTFTVQVDGRKPDGTRTSRREKVGTFPEMSVSAARERARAVQIELGKRRPREEPDAYTLQRGWDAYRELMVRKVAAGEKSAATLANYDRAYRHVEDWAGKPLAEISGSTEMVQRRFRDITDGRVVAERLRGGKGAANLVAVFLGVVYRYVQDSGLQRDLPDFVPSRAVRHEMHTLPRRRRALAARDLPAWNAQRLALSPVRREFHLLNLLTGSRQEQLRTLRWADVDLDAGTIHFPKPKGGTSRAYTIPMSAAIRECLMRARDAGRMLNERAARTYVFPSEPSKSRGRKDGASPSQHMVEHKEDRARLSHWGSDLRRTYKTLGKEAGVPEFLLDLFQNHAQGGVSRGYNIREVMGGDFLAEAQERISYYLTEHMDNTTSHRREG
ncbi:MAG: tyrosine-type recombinase/integrase [Pseudomonadota bacterium]